MKRWLVFSLSLLIVLVASFLLSQVPQSDFLVEEHSVGVGPYSYVVWLDENQLVLMNTDDSEGKTWAYSDHLQQFDLRTAELRELNLVSWDKCLNSAELFPARLPNGSLGYVFQCQAEPFVHGEQFLMEYDQSSGTNSQLLEYPLPAIGTGRLAQSWNPDMTVGLSSYGPRFLTEKLYSFTKDGWEILDLPFPLSFAPAWSPDGTQVAFFAAEREGSIRGPANRYYLYTMAPTTLEYRKLVNTAFYKVVGVQWSPDGRWLAFAGQRRPTPLTRREGLWLVNADTREFYQIAVGEYTITSWSPDGNYLVSLQISDPRQLSNREVKIFDVEGLLQELQEQP